MRYLQGVGEGGEVGEYLSLILPLAELSQKRMRSIQVNLRQLVVRFLSMAMSA